MSKKALAIIILISVPIFNFSQTFKIHKNDGTVQNFDVNDIDSITYHDAAPFHCGEKILYEEKTYETVLIGDQCWFKQNLDVGSSTPVNGQIHKYCYKDQDTNCTKYGGLYYWDDAIEFLNSNGTKGICPAGWRIPSESDFMILKTTVNDDGNTLKAVGEGTGDGIGTNTSGFSALLVEHRLLVHAYFWSSTATSADGATRMALHKDSNKIGLGHNNKEENVFSIRCLRN
jgi:uncharacterized protein (TIGR02145 family)